MQVFNVESILLMIALFQLKNCGIPWQFYDFLSTGKMLAFHCDSDISTRFAHSTKYRFTRAHCDGAAAPSSVKQRGLEPLTNFDDAVAGVP